MAGKSNKTPSSRGKPRPTNRGAKTSPRRAKIASGPMSDGYIAKHFKAVGGNAVPKAGVHDYARGTSSSTQTGKAKPNRSPAKRRRK